VWPIGWYHSVLFDKSSPTLRLLDRQIRRALSRGYPDDWSPPTFTVGDQTVESRALIAIYHALYASERDDWQLAVAELRSVNSNDLSEHVRARAHQLLVQILYTNSLFMMAEEDLNSSETLERECRELAVHALTAYPGYPWTAAVTHVCHAALGTLDFYVGDVESSLIHLRMALAEFNEIGDRQERKNRQNVGFVNLCYGSIAEGRGDVIGASEWYSKAIANLSGGPQLSAYCYLGAALLKAKDPKGARSLMRKALREGTQQRASEIVLDRVRGFLAEASIQLHDDQTAEQLLRESLSSGPDSPWKVRAAAWLAARARQEPRRPPRG